MRIATLRTAARSVRARASTFSTDRFLDEVAFVAPPPHLNPFLRVLAAQGMELTAPTDRADLMPLVIPIAKRGSEIVGFLRWPTPQEHPRMELPIVSTTRGGGSLRFLARSVEEYLTRALVEEDAERVRATVFFQSLSFFRRFHFIHCVLLFPSFTLILISPGL